MPQRKITTLLNEQRKQGWLEGQKAGERAALVRLAGMSYREAAELCGCTESSIGNAVRRVRERCGEALPSATATENGNAGLPSEDRLKIEAWIILQRRGLHTVEDVAEHVRLVHVGERETEDLENLHRLARLVGAHVPD